MKPKKQKLGKIDEALAEAVKKRLFTHFAQLEESKYSQLIVEVKDSYVYLSYLSLPSFFDKINPFASARSRYPSPLARMVYQGNSEDWDLQMYLYSRGKYDTKGEYWTTGGLPEECIETALSMYQLPGSSQRVAKQEELRAQKEAQLTAHLHQNIVVEKDRNNSLILHVVSPYRDDLLPYGCFPTVITRILTYGTDSYIAEEHIYYGFYGPSEKKDTDERVYDTAFKIIPWLMEICQRHELLNPQEEIDTSIGMLHKELEVVEGCIPDAPKLQAAIDKGLAFYPLLSSVSEGGRITKKAIELGEKRRDLE